MLNVIRRPELFRGSVVSFVEQGVKRLDHQFFVSVFLSFHKAKKIVAFARRGSLDGDFMEIDGH